MNRVVSSLLRGQAGRRLSSLSEAAPLLVATSFSAWLVILSFDNQSIARMEKSPSDSDGKKSSESGSSSFFDATREWNNALATITAKITQSDADGNDSGKESSSEDVKKTVSDFWNQIFNKNNDTDNIDKASENPSSASSFDSFLQFTSVYADFTKILSGKGNEDVVKDLVIQVREQTKQGHDQDNTSFYDIFQMLQSHKEDLEEVMNKYMAKIDVASLDPTAVFYYMEYEDERKNPSWKRRIHRFCSSIDIRMLEELHRTMEISKLCYGESVEDIKLGLECGPVPYELVYADLSSKPGQPAHIVAIKRNQSLWSSKLEVLIGVRGTKSIADALTDLMCDTEQYKDGKAHAYILKSGKYLVQKHTKLLEELLQKSGKSKIKLSLVGHSLGAGAASIAGMEWNDDPRFEVDVVGFGCPALVSKELAEASTYITTVVNDWDVVPRLSGISIVNILLDIIDFNWQPYAKKDIRGTLEELQRRQSMIPKEAVDQVMAYVNDILDSYPEKATVAEKGTNIERVEPDLYPPGRCIHFYNDGSQLAAAYVTNNFFREIDLNRRMVVGTSTANCSLMSLCSL